MLREGLDHRHQPAQNQISHQGEVTTIRVLVADDHPVTRERLRTALDLANDVVILGEADSGETAIEKAGELTPDIVFMDADMPGIGGIAAAKEIKRAAPGVRVILLTGDGSRASVLEANRAEVSGYLLKNADAEGLVNAARLALEGKVVIHAALVTKFLQELQRGKWGGVTYGRRSRTRSTPVHGDEDAGEGLLGDRARSRLVLEARG